MSSSPHEIASVKRWAVMCLLLLSAVVGWSQQSAFELTAVRYHVDGITQEWALAAAVEMEIGTTFEDRAILDTYVGDKTQELLNIRTLHDARIEATISDRPGMPSAVSLDVFVVDTVNIIALPYPKYDSNDGLLLSLRARNYNFLGTLEPLRLNLNYLRTPEEEHEWSVVTSFTLPFQWVEHDWRWTAGGGFEYEGGDFDVDLSNTLAIDFALWPSTWTLAYSQAGRWLTDTAEADVDDWWGGYYLTSGLSFGTSIQTGLFLPVLREIKYNPSIFADVIYRVDKPVSESRRGMEPGFSHSLTAGRVDWIGNYREGAKASLSNSISYNKHQYDHGDWEPVIAGKASGYLELFPFAFSGRTGGFYRFNTIDDDAADSVRGVIDDDMQGHSSLYWNTDITLKVKTFCGLLEGQGSVFFDGAYVANTDDDTDDLRYGVGIEAIGFLIKRRSIYMRASLGVDLTEIIESGGWERRNKEIFVGFGHHY